MPGTDLKKYKNCTLFTLGPFLTKTIGNIRKNKNNIFIETAADQLIQV